MTDIYDPTKEKWCSGCRKYLKLADFIPPRGAGVPMAKCIECTRQYNKDRKFIKYATDNTEYPVPECCPLCLRPFGPLKNDQPHGDHDHITITFRGWICGRCNIALGYIGDSIDTLERMAQYLREHQEKMKDSQTRYEESGIPQGSADILSQVMKKRQGSV